MSAPRTISFYTLGCKLNFSETSSIGRSAEEAGFIQVPFDYGADVYVINTCSVTEFADRKCRQFVRRAHRANNQARIVVIGCYAQLKPKEIAEIEGVDLVLGAAEKFRLPEYLTTLFEEAHKPGRIHTAPVQNADTFLPSAGLGDRTRSFMKVQDGCDYKCSFCTIPQARGASRSDTVDSAVARAIDLAEKGVKEIVLTGVNLGDFGQGTAVLEGKRSKKEALFIDLIRALDEKVPVERFRISSIEPNLLTDEIIDFVATSKRFMPHFHIPLQSGNDKLLAKMRRRYRRDLYRERVEMIRDSMPHACIGADVIVGFPGETDALFLDSHQFIQDLPINYLHVFTYSERANTLAAAMSQVVPVAVRRARNKRLTLLSEEKLRTFYTAHKGTVRPALLEAGKEKGYLTGLTDNYIRIRIPEDQLSPNHLLPIQLVDGETTGRMNAIAIGVTENA